jgi:hypothetical protein
VLSDVHKRASCIARVADETKRFDLCQVIPFPLERWRCESQIARARMDADLCGRIDDVSARDACLMDVSRSASQPEVVCARIELYDARIGCYQRAVSRDPQTASRNLELCERVGSSPHSADRETCYDGAISFLTDPTVCARIHDARTAERCRAKVGARNHDATICEHVQDHRLRDECWVQVAHAGDATACAKIAGHSDQRRCAEQLWSKAKDPGICAWVRPQDRARCRATAAINNKPAKGT